VVESPLDTAEIVGAYTVLADPDLRKEYSHACSDLGDYLSAERHVKELLDAYSRAPRIQA
jgi:hypothetical protein